MGRRPLSRAYLERPWDGRQPGCRLARCLASGCLAWSCLARGHPAGPVTAGYVLMAARRPVRGIGYLSVIDEPDDTLGTQRVTIFMGVDRKVRQGIASDGVQDSAGIFRDNLDVVIKQHPVAGQRLVAVTQRVPAMMGLCILED